MKKLLTMFLFMAATISMVSLTSCSKDDDNTDDNNTPQKTWTIYEYGRPSCGYCMALKQELEDANIAFTFYNIDDEPDKNSEMWQKLNDAGMGGGSVGIPVVDVMVDGVSHIFIRPDLDADIRPLIED
jgi:glutaredoxin